MVFVFGSVYVVNYVDRLAYIKPALHPQDEAYLIMMDNLFDVWLHSVCQYFIEDFCIAVHHGYWPEIFFFQLCLCQVWYQDDIGLINWVREYSFFLYCWNSFRRSGTSSSLYIW